MNADDADGSPARTRGTCYRRRPITRLRRFERRGAHPRSSCGSIHSVYRRCRRFLSRSPLTLTPSHSDLLRCFATKGRHTMAGAEWYYVEGGAQAGPLSLGRAGRRHQAQGRRHAGLRPRHGRLDAGAAGAGDRRRGSGCGPRRSPRRRRSTTRCRTPARPDRRRHRLPDLRRGDAVRRNHARPGRDRPRRGRRHDVHDHRHQDGNRLRRPVGAEPGLLGQDRVGRQAHDHRRVAVRDDVHRRSASKREVVAFASPYPGKIIPMHLDQHGGEIICQKDSFVCAAKGIQIGIAFQKKIGVGLFGGEGFIMQRLTGDGIALVHAGGTIMSRDARGRARRSSSTPAASSRWSARSPTTSSSSAASRTRSSAAKGCSSRR